MPRKQEEVSREFIEELVDENTESKKENIYWSPAKSYQLGNFQEEKRAQSGHITQREIPVRFSEHIFVTDDQKKIDYIEGNEEKGIKPSDGFEAREIVKCKDMKEALLLTAQHTRMKSVRTLHSVVDEAVTVK